MDITTDESVQPLKDVTLTVTYKNSDIIGLDENKLVMARFNTDNNLWVILVSVVDTTNHKITATTNHLSLFEIMEYQPYLSSTVNTVKVYPNPYIPGDVKYGNTLLGTGIVFSGYQLQKQK